MEIDRVALVDGLRELVSTPSVNPSLGPGDDETEGEALAAAIVATALTDAGLDVELIEPVPGRPSVVGTLRGQGDGPTLMLNGHIDTVPSGGMSRAFSPRVEGSRLYGRGAYDMKGGVAACIAAARALAASGAPFAGTLQVSAVADEEYGSLGTMAVLERAVPDAVILTEPTGLVACSAHRGFAWIEIRTRGRAAHGSMPELGVDANLMMGRVMSAIDGISRSLADVPPHPVVGAGSLHLGRLEGGGVWSIYADRCRLGLERRTVPGETADELVEEIEGVLARLARQDPDFEGEVELVLDRPPFEAAGDSPIRAAVGNGGGTRGGPGRHAVPFWTDAALFAAAGVDAVVLGPEGEGAHADVEWVDLASVETLATLLVRASLAYLSAPVPDPGVPA